MSTGTIQTLQREVDELRYRLDVLENMLREKNVLKSTVLLPDDPRAISYDTLRAAYDEAQEKAE